jgi:hypothetical protein
MFKSGVASVIEVGEHHGDGDYVEEWWTTWRALRKINI